jgi:hypothetical protein
VLFRDPAHDGETEAAAGLIHFAAAVKAVEHALAFLRRDARSVVGNFDDEAFAGALCGHVHVSSDRRVTQGVVDQIRYKRAQSFDVTVHDQPVVGPRQSEIDALVVGKAGMRDDDLAHERTKIHISEGAFRGTRFGARQREKLLDEMRCALDAFFERVERCCAFARFRRAFGELGLQAKCGERRSQLMRSIGNECTLHFQRTR